MRFADAKSPIVIDCRHIQYADFTAGEGMRDLVLRLNHNGLQIVFWKMKPSILSILVGVMTGTGARFIHCETEEQVENLIDGISRKPVIGGVEIVVDGPSENGVSF